MATPSAILSILVQADTTKATAALRTFDRSVARTGTTSKAATTHTSSLNKATGSLGTGLKRAAGYAAGAAAAYISISQAKDAVTTTQDLAKTTAGLNRNLGITNKQGSRWAAVAKARDIDAKSLNMSFTTLSRRLTDAAKGSDTALDSFKDIGLTQKDLARTNGDFNKQVLAVADAFGQAEGGAVRQQAAQKLLGRGYQTLLPMFAEGSKGLEEQMGWADKYGSVMDKKAVKAQMDLVSAQRESKAAITGLKVSFATALTPALEKANKQFQRIAHIIGSDKLSNAEKFEKVGRIISKWADKAFDAFIDMMPKLVSEVGERAPRVAGAFVKGFMDAPVLGKLLLGGWLFSKMGGVTAATATGTKLGNAIGKAAGPAAAAWIAYEIMKKGPDYYVDLIKHDTELPDMSEKKTAKVLAFAEDAGIDDILVALDAYEEANAKTAGKVKGNWTKFYDAMEHITRRGGEVNNAAAKKGLDRLEDGFGNTRERLDSTTARQATDVGNNTASMVTAVAKGLTTLKDNTNKALTAFKVQNIAFSVKEIAQNATKKLQRGGPINTGAPSGDSVPALLERGEYVLNRNAVSAVGKGKLDAINFGAAKRFQKGGNVGAMSAEAARIDSLGLNYVWGGSHGQTPTPKNGPFDCSSAVSHILQFGGYDIPTMVSGQLANWGASGPGKDISIYANASHVLMSILGKFWGTSASNPGGGPGWIPTPDPGYLSGFSVRHPSGTPTGVAGMVAQQLKRLLLEGPAGPLRSMGQGALDKTRKAANDFISKKSSPMGGDPNLPSIGGSGSLDKGELTSLWSKVNPGNGNANLMAAIAMAESMGNPNAINSIGAKGLWQIIPSTAGAFGLNYGKLFDPAYNAFGAGKILQGQGLNAWETYSLGMHQQYLQRGGQAGLPYVGKYHQGGIAPREGLAHVAKGEPIGAGAVNVNVYVDPVSLDARVETIVGNMAPEIAEFSARQLGRSSGRSRQLAR